jgi:hypothetical protein
MADRLAREESDEQRQVAKTTEPAAPRALSEPAPSQPTMTPPEARTFLGTEPAAIPGFPILALRRNPAIPGEIVVEQRLDSGVVVSLFERRTGAATETLRGSVRTDSVSNFAAPPPTRARANERLARFVGGLRIEIAGPLPTDSLSKLLELVRP